MKRFFNRRVLVRILASFILLYALFVVIENWTGPQTKLPVVESQLERSRPMLWVFPKYQGQVAVRLGQMKLVRQNLNTKQPGAWEVYDVSKDPAPSNAHLIAEAEALLRREVSDNAVFPLAIPNVNAN